MAKIVSIDPSIRYCGVALWEYQAANKAAALISWDCISNHSSHAAVEEWIQAAVSNASMLKPYIKGATTVILESPMRWGHSEKSQIAYAKQSLDKLNYFCGMIAMLVANYNAQLVRYTPTQWKGTRPKEVTTARVNTKFQLTLNPKTKEHNIADAIGIGAYWFEQNGISLRKL